MEVLRLAACAALTALLLTVACGDHARVPVDPGDGGQLQVPIPLRDAGSKVSTLCEHVVNDCAKVYDSVASCRADYDYYVVPFIDHAGSGSCASAADSFLQCQIDTPCAAAADLTDELFDGVCGAQLRAAYDACVGDIAVTVNDVERRWCERDRTCDPDDFGEYKSIADCVAQNELFTVLTVLHGGSDCRKDLVAHTECLVALSCESFVAEGCFAESETADRSCAEER